MILVVDIGNTNTVIGIYQGKQLVTSWRVATDKSKTADEVGMLFMQLFNYESIEVSNIENVIISSVVPSIIHTVEYAIRKYIAKEIIIVGPGVKTGMNIKYDNPREVGADRIVNAVAGYEIYGGPLIIVDFGTATTFCAISGKGEYLGGAICPGINISMEALFEKASKLPRIEIIKPEKIIGKNTVESMQAGVVYGYVGQVDYIVNRMKKEIREYLLTEEEWIEHDIKINIIATGGLATMLATESSTIDKVNNLLTIEGLRIIYERNNERGLK